jgi:hypothetical protein
MMKALYVVALLLGAVVIGNGCVGEDKTAVDNALVVGGEQCGTKVCSGKTFCCNASCSICAPIGGGCTQQVCLTADTDDVTDADEELSTPASDVALAEPAPVADTNAGNAANPDQVDSNIVIGPIGPQQCGSVTCPSGTHCCNASCGTCVPPGWECTQQVCEPKD